MSKETVLAKGTKIHEYFEELHDSHNILLLSAIKANQYLAYLASEGQLKCGEQFNWEAVQQNLSDAIKKATPNK